MATSSVNKYSLLSVVVIAAGIAFSAFPARAGKRAIDVQHSVLRVRVFKAGFFSALGHEHEIAAPIAAGDVDNSEHARVAFRVDAAKLKVLDPGASEADRAKVQKTMETEVLDIARFPEIRFASTQVRRDGPGHWEVQGNLTLHGQTKSLQVKVTEFPGEYRGVVTVKQSDFGIAPISVGGGAVKVKDDVKIEFVIALAQ